MGFQSATVYNKYIMQSMLLFGEQISDICSWFLYSFGFTDTKQTCEFYLFSAYLPSIPLEELPYLLSDLKAVKRIWDVLEIKRRELCSLSKVVSLLSDIVKN